VGEIFRGLTRLLIRNMETGTGGRQNGHPVFMYQDGSRA